MANEKEDDLKSMECSLCHDFPTEPKLLSCQHTFCEHCLVLLYQSQIKDGQLSCPDCRKTSHVPDGEISRLDTNTKLKSLVESMKVTEKYCTVCEEGTKTPSTTYCQTCTDYLCNECLDLHRKWKRNASHKVVGVDDIKSGDVKIERFCPKHPKEERECICITCKEAICFKCSKLDHNGPEHDVEEVEEYTNRIAAEVESLQMKTEVKISTFEDHVKLIDEESVKVKDILDERIEIVNRMYDECVQKLTEKKNELIGKCTKHKETLMSELLKIRGNDVKLITGFRGASDLVGNGAKVLLEGQALTVHTNLRGDLREMLKERNPSEEQVRNLTKGAENVQFRMHRENNSLNSGEIVLNNWTLEKLNVFPLAGTDLYDLVPTLDGKMAVGYLGGGIELFTVDGPQETVRTSTKLTYRPSTQGGRRSSKTVLDNENIGRVGVLSDGRFVVQNEKHNISLYTREWKKVNVEFETLDEGGFGGMSVDVDDRIYVGYWFARKILVFNPEGGAPIREIPCHDYEPVEICPLNFTKMLVVRDLSTVRVVDETGTVIYTVNKDFVTARLAVLRDDSVLIGWVKDGGLLSLDLYTHELKFVATVLSNFTVDGEFRIIREFSTGEVALCDDRNFYVFRKSK